MLQDAVAEAFDLVVCGGTVIDGTGAPARRASWIWPVAFVLVGLLLVFYREA